MSFLVPSAPLPQSAVLGDQYLVSFGKSAAVGVFTTSFAGPLRRGEVVVVHTPRGVEKGTVLAPATLRQSRVLGAAISGDLLRSWSDDDERTLGQLKVASEKIFARARSRAQDQNLRVALLDVDFLLESPCVILQFAGSESDDRLGDLATSLRLEFGVEVRLENLAVPEEPHEHVGGGCDKPDCGRGNSEGGGCSTCSTGGGCSSCGSAKVDLRPYFAHLRAEMEEKHRRPLN